MNPKTGIVLTIVLSVLVMYIIFSRKNKKISGILLVILYLIMKNESILEYSNCDSHHCKFLKVFSEKSKEMYNPSLCKIDEGFLICARKSSSSYKNLFSHFAGLFNYNSSIVFIKTIRNSATYIYPEQIKNLEDPRMIKYKNMYLVSANEYLTIDKNYPVISVYNRKYEFVKRVDYNRNDYNGNAKGVQKNWCLFVKNQELYVHTDTYPRWKVFILDLENGRMQKIVDWDSRNFFKKFEGVVLRNSTSWKNFDSDNFICGLHTRTVNLIPQIRSLFVLINYDTFLPEKQTNILCLEKDRCNRVQYLSGLETDDDYVYLGYGLNDAEIGIRKIMKSNIEWN